MEPAKQAKHTKEETLRQVDRLTHWVNLAKVTTPSFRVFRGSSIPVFRLTADAGYHWDTPGLTWDGFAPETSTPNSMLQNLIDLNMPGVTPIAPIMGLVGWQWIYILWGIPALVMAVIIYFFLTDKPRQAMWLLPAEREALENALANERAATADAHSHRALAGLLHPRVWLLAIAMCCTVTATYAVEFFMPTIIKEWYGLDIGQLTWAIILPPALALIAQPATAWSSAPRTARHHY